MQDEIFQKDDGFWYFWNETWAIEYGPYATREQAKIEWLGYCEENELEL